VLILAKIEVSCASTSDTVGRVFNKSSATETPGSDFIFTFSTSSRISFVSLTSLSSFISFFKSLLFSALFPLDSLLILSSSLCFFSFSSLSCLCEEEEEDS